jgi:SAM-dependent methyltransferase
MSQYVEEFAVEHHEQVTIAEYQTTAESFREGTWEHDVSQNRQALVAAMPSYPGRILDLGCGPGRDIVAFQADGHEVIGLDATPAFVVMAHQAGGGEVWQQNFLNLDLPEQFFDGIFANASLLHVPQTDMLRVLQNLYRSLVAGGAIMMSLARGNGEGFVDRLTGQRYTSYWEYETIAPLIEQAGFLINHHYYRPPGLPPAMQSWLVVVANRSGVISANALNP